MKKIFLLLILIATAYFASGQVPTRWNKNSSPFEFVWQINDSINRMPLDTLTGAPNGSLAMKNHGLWFKDTIWKKVAYLTDVTGGGGGGGIWGGITGTLSDQGDLQAALDLKLRISDTAGMLSAYVRSIGNLSPLFTASISSHGISFSLSNASPYTIFGRGSGTGAPSYQSALDSNWIPGLHTQAYYDARYVQSVAGGGGVMTFSNGLQQVGTSVVALPDLAIWNARQFQNFPIQSGSPSNGDMWQFQDGTWTLVNVDDLPAGGGSGGGGGGVPIGNLSVDTTHHRLATVIDSTNAVLKSFRIDINGEELDPAEETDSTLRYDIPIPSLNDILAQDSATIHDIIFNDDASITLNVPVGFGSFAIIGVSDIALQLGNFGGGVNQGYMKMWDGAGNGMTLYAEDASASPVIVFPYKSGRLATQEEIFTMSGKGADYTLTSDDVFVYVFVTGKTMTLPSAVGIGGKEYEVKLTVSGTGTVATTSSQTIDGSTTYSLSAQWKYVRVKSDGSNWLIIANN